MLQKKTIMFLTIFGPWLIASIWPFQETMAEGSTRVALEQPEMLQVKVFRLIVDPNSKKPVVSLSDSREERALFIWIDFFEARAIYSEIQGVKHLRPLTHDLLERIIKKVNGKIHHIVITHVKENIYYATIVIEKEDSLVEIDARPSDSIVMALKFKAPIFVSKTLFKDLSLPIGEQKEIEEAYGLTLQNLTPSLANYLSYDSNQGVLVSNVRKGSRADQDGIEIGDIFVEVEGQTIDNVMSMKDALAKIKTSAKANIFRKSRLISITLQPNRFYPK
jgi:bifunctional DNase/RNase